MSAFGTDPNVGVVGGRIEALNDTEFFPDFIHWAHYYMEDSDGSEIIPVVGTNMAFRREVFLQKGGFLKTSNPVVMKPVFLM